MTPAYSETVCRQLEQKFRQLGLHRPPRIRRYDAGQVLSCNAVSIDGQHDIDLKLRIERFVGGGFAGQVYRVHLEKIVGMPPDGLTEGSCYAMKILIPPSGFAMLFRNLVYAIGFQAPFQLQTNPTAARCGALWQKFFRRGAKIRFGDAQSVNDIHVTFTDENLGSCAELSDWVEGRTWRLEVDDHMDVLKLWKHNKPYPPDKLGSPEYRSKQEFMRAFVRLLHDMGGHEFARQYEWSTCKSQPNCLKRINASDEPSAGLTAVDFRAGLALLPFLPMSPGDFKLIWDGLRRGSLVQFDRGDVAQLKRFMDQHPNDFADMLAQYDELVACENKYRDSQPDISRNLLRLFHDGNLWSTIFDSARTGWWITNTIDKSSLERLRNNCLLTLLMYVCSLLPFCGRFIRTCTYHRAWRNHYLRLAKPGYLLKALRGTMLERIVNWHRAGRIDAAKAQCIARSPGRAFGHLLLSFLPVGLHKFFTDWYFAKERLAYIFVRPVRLYFDPALREQWLRDMLCDGLRQNSLSAEDADIIRGQINEPFIQKYLKSLAVHVCTLPVTQVVSVLVAVIYVFMNPELSTEQAWLRAGFIIAAFQVVPVSPGSLVRGLYVLYLVIRERNFKDYNIAVFLGFFKYIGYLAFPLQMAYRYPTLARFMAVHWATGAVPAVPVFGERGALLERGVFCTFYNWPLTIRRRIRDRMRHLAYTPARIWHLPVITTLSAMLLQGIDVLRMGPFNQLPGIGDTWFVLALIALLSGAVMSRWSGGLGIARRIVCSTCSGTAVGLVYTLLTAFFFTAHAGVADLISLLVWRIFVLTIFSTIGAVLNEIFQDDPAL